VAERSGGVKGNEPATEPSAKPKVMALPGPLSRQCWQLDTREARCLSRVCRAWVRSSAGEHRLHTAGVTGSIPVAPTMFLDLADQLESGDSVAQPRCYRSTVCNSSTHQGAAPMASSGSTGRSTDAEL
jgi:hypothetical protein